MKNGDMWTVRVTDAQTGTIEDGGKYIIYFPYGNDYYYVLKGNGETERLYVGSNADQVLNNLGDEYLWTFDNPWYGFCQVHSNSGLYLQLDETRRSQDSVTSYNPTGVRFVRDGDNSFPYFFVSEYSSNNNCNGFGPRKTIEVFLFEMLTRNYRC